MSKSRFFTEDWSKPLPVNNPKPDYSSDDDVLDSLFNSPSFTKVIQHPQLEQLAGTPSIGDTIFVGGLFYYCKEILITHLTPFQLSITMNAEMLAIGRAMNDANIQLALQGSVQSPNDFVMGIYNEINNGGEDYHIGVFKR
jgi:hypothetical protein